MFNKGQLAGLMKQAKAMQDNLKKAQDELANVEVEGESGAGLVKVLMTCKHDVKRVTIDPSLLADDKYMLEDLVAAAFNAAVRKAEETSAEKMGKITAGMPGLPGGMKFPFLGGGYCAPAMRRWAALAILTTREVALVAVLRPPSLAGARYALGGGVKSPHLISNSFYSHVHHQHP